MAMSENTLASGLLALTPTDSEAVAIQNLATAYADFAAEASASSTILAGGVALGRAAMEPALVGMSGSGGAAQALTAAVTAFWAAVAGGLTTSFTSAVAIVPPPHAGLQGSLESVFEINRDGNLPLTTATANIASVLYAAAIVGGSVDVGSGPVPIV